MIEYCDEVLRKARWQLREWEDQKVLRLMAVAAASHKLKGKTTLEAIYFLALKEGWHLRSSVVDGVYNIDAAISFPAEESEILNFKLR